MKFHKTSQLKRRKKKIIGQYALFWPPTLVFLTIVRSVGTIEVGSFDPGLLPAILMAAIIGFIGGVISGYFQFMLEEKIYGRTSIRKLALAKGIFIVIFLVTLIIIAFIMTRIIFHHDIDFITFAFDAGSAPVYLYIISVDIFMTRLRQVNLMLGEGNLTKLLAGKLYTPHEEDRIFMFLDLQSSTTLAENLGHIKYSQMIQDCFFDLGVTNAYRAEIYQYVGDEAVLTWPLQEGLERDNCLKAYYDFMDTLESKREYYQNKYGSLPFFKAALNWGTVTATEVGRYKREIAYHGDTLNTAARILAKCNEFNEEMLISENLRQVINTSNFEFNPMGEVPLRGKKEAVPIFAVKRKNSL